MRKKWKLVGVGSLHQAVPVMTAFGGDPVSFVVLPRVGLFYSGLHAQLGQELFGFRFIAGVAWNDANRDGIRNNGEARLAGITVEARDQFGNLVASTVTDSDGVYSFDSLQTGYYTIVFVKPNSNDQFANANQGSDDSIDSDVNSSGSSVLFSFTEESFFEGIDAGFWLYDNGANPPPGEVIIPLP